MKTRGEFGFARQEFADPNGDFFVLIPKSAGDFGDSAGERTEGGRGGIWIFNCDPNRTIRLSGFDNLGPDFSSNR